ncbi:uncharacterized protein [Eurosta solidaginis]|uniref:uncharacterized protein n=1 Tax=Eurosta solidaginis TaxID=178769 RepID=UPI0035317A42
MQLLRNEMYPQSELDNYKLQVDLLQQKLKQSEENRQQLQKELQQILQRRSEHDKTVRSKIRQKYQSFLDEQERRNERNKMLMQMLERIDQQSAALSARSERLKSMKLKYERHFAKVMQTQPVRCVQNTALATEVPPIVSIPTATQIPVLLPAVEAQQQMNTNSTAATTTKPTTKDPMEEVKVNESAATVLTPRMWTFAMATPTPAGLILTGTPTAPLATKPLPATVQYPIGYGTMLQPQPQQFQNPERMRFRHRFGYPPSADSYNRGNSYGVWDDNFPVDTRDACTSTSRGNVRKDNEKFENIDSTYATTSQQTDIKGTDNLPGHELDLEIKISEQSVVTAATDPSRHINNIISDIAGVRLGDTCDDTKTFCVSSDNFENPTMAAKVSENYNETSFGPNSFMKHENTWEKRGPTGLLSAEEHKRKLAEIERRYGTAEIERMYGTTDFGEHDGSSAREKDNTNYESFERFSDIVNSTAKSNDEELMKSIEKTNNQRTETWQSRTSPNEYATKKILPSAVVAPKKVSIDNIENAIYGELVTPHLIDTKAAPIGAAAQGFLTELLGQQETKTLDDGGKDTHTDDAEIIEANGTETAADSAVKKNDTANLGYANCSTSIESSESTASKVEEAVSNNAVGDTIEPTQQQPTYNTINTEFYPQTTAPENTYGSAEPSNTYAEYSAEQISEQPTAEDNTVNHQMQSAQEDYAQQGYENYDADQYGNYDPNAYPGYIFDEATGQYVVDPQYAVAEAGETQQAEYATQEYSETQLPTEQLEYQESVVDQVGQNDTNYAFEDNSYTADQAPAVAQQDSVAAPSLQGDVAKHATTAPMKASESAVPPVSESAPKLVKPTSILATADKQATQSEAQKKKKRVNFVDSSETDDSSSVKVTGTAKAATTLGAGGSESDFEFSSGAETSSG